MPDMPVGRFGCVRGATLAAADRFDLVVRGRSGHAAHPHASIDPIVAAAAFVSEAQTVVSREIKPLHPAVVTIGQFQGGTTHNIIPERVHLKGTVRTLHAEARDTAEAALRRLVAGLETGMRVSCAFDYRRLVPALVNDDRVLDPLMASVRRQFGDERVEEGEAVMGAEDFAAFAAVVPSAHLRIGSGAPGRDDRLHNADYQPDERCIGLGVAGAEPRRAGHARLNHRIAELTAPEAAERLRGRRLRHPADGQPGNPRPARAHGRLPPRRGDQARASRSARPRPAAPTRWCCRPSPSAARISSTPCRAASRCPCRCSKASWRKRRKPCSATARGGCWW